MKFSHGIDGLVLIVEVKWSGIGTCIGTMILNGENTPNGIPIEARGIFILNGVSTMDQLCETGAKSALMGALVTHGIKITPTHLKLFDVINRLIKATYVENLIAAGMVPKASAD